MTRATRLSVLLAALLVSGSPVAHSTDEPTDEAATEAEAAGDDDAGHPPLPDAASGYRRVQRLEFDRIERVTGLDLSAVMACQEAAEVRRRERMVTRRVPLTVYVLDDLSLHVALDGDDTDGEITECFDQAVGGMELEPAPADLAGSRYGTVVYDDNYFPRRRTRHGEIIALYTLTGVSAGV